MKVCPYCMTAHHRPDPAVYCGPDCSRKASRQNARASGALRRMWARRRRLAQQTAVTDSRYRDAAAGRKSVEQLVAEVFGVAEIPPMRDTSL